MKAHIICRRSFTVVIRQNPCKNLELFSVLTCVFIRVFISCCAALSSLQIFETAGYIFKRRNTGIFHVLPSYIINYFVLHNTIIFTLSFLNYGCLGKIYIYGDNHILILAKERMRHFALTTSSIIQLQNPWLLQRHCKSS